jgi:type IV secretory pathway VirB10-like protein
MSDRIPASQTDGPSRSPRLLARSPTRGRGVRRLNKVPVLIFVGGVCLVITAIGYTYHARLQSSVAAVREADVRAEGASGAAVLNGAPQTGEIASAAGRKPVTEPADARATTLTTTTQSAPADAGKTPQEPAADDPATQARKQAWQTYYQQLAALEQVRLQAGMDALKADTSPGGMTANGGAAPQASGAAGTGNLDPQMASAQAGSFQAAGVGAGFGNASSSGGFGYAPGGLSVGGYPIMAAAGPDATGAREKQTFTRQTGNLGQNDTLASTVRDPISPYLVTAGDVIPCVSQSGEDSDTPGQFVGRVSRNVYDSATGRFLLIPQNSKVIGTYDNVVTNGQIRIPTVVTRIIFPDSSSIPIGAMPAADQAGFAGLHDQVETHLWEKFGNALILAIGGAGIQLSQGTGQNTNGYNAQQIGAAAIGQQFGELGEEYARSGLSIPNTLRIRNGYNFVVQVTKDMVLRPYVDRRDAGVQPVSLGPVMQ